MKRPAGSATDERCCSPPAPRSSSACSPDWRRHFKPGAPTSRSDLKAGSREGTYGRSRARIALLLLQGALSVVLLVGAGLFVRSLQQRAVACGSASTSIRLLFIDLKMRGVKLDSAQTVELRQRLLANGEDGSGCRKRESRGCHSVLESVESTAVRRRHRHGERAVQPQRRFAGVFRDDGNATHSRTRHLPIRTRRDTPRAVVVSENMGKTLWPGRDPIGQCMQDQRGHDAVHLRRRRSPRTSRIRVSRRTRGTTTTCPRRSSIQRLVD